MRFIVCFSTERSNVVPLLQLFFVYTTVISCMAFALSLFVPHLSFFWCLGKGVLHDCGISWLYLHTRDVRNELLISIWRLQISS